MWKFTVAPRAMVLISGLIIGATFSVTLPVSAQTAKLQALGGAADDEFGHAVAVDGTTLIVGSPGDDDQGADSGSASIFVFDGNNWNLQQKLLPTPSSSNALFGSAVAILANTVVVGAYGDANAGPFAGAVYVFTRSGNNWSMSQKLSAADATATKYFGYALAVTIDTLVVGASGDATQGGSAGAVYVFSLNGGAFVPQQKLLASDGSSNNNLGVAVAISGSTILAGASGDVDNGVGAGRAYVFVKGTTGAFAQQQKLVSTSGSLNDNFGNAVALKNDVALIGAFADDARGTDAGAAYVFVRSGSTWTLSQKLFALDAAAGDLFGFSVDLTEHDAVIGAPNDEDHGAGSGSAYTFRSNDTWVERTKLHATDPAAFDFFGYAVALRGSEMLIGANGKQDFGSNSGAAYLVSQTPTMVPALGNIGVALLLSLLLLIGWKLRRTRSTQ